MARTDSISSGTFLSDALNEVFFGRRNAIMFSAILIFTSAIGSAYVEGWKSLLGLRVLLGVGMGCKAAVVPVFAAEIAPAHLRGDCLSVDWPSMRELIYDRDARYELASLRCFRHPARVHCKLGRLQNRYVT